VREEIIEGRSTIYENAKRICRMKESNEGIIIGVLGAAAVVIILLVKDRISDVLRRREDTPEKLPAELHTLMHPDWAFYERHLQRPAPAALRELYSDMALIKACASFPSKREEISAFWPLNEDYLLDTRDDLGYDIVAFATSGCGDSIYLKPGANEPDTVYIAYHDDPGYVEVFADSVDIMLQKAREVIRAT